MTKAFAVSFGVGIAVGLIYAALKVKSPAPPLIALAGLLGMVIGEHVPAWWLAFGPKAPHL